MTALRVTNASVVVPGHTLLDNVSLSVATGSWLTVIGPNGAGKTTLVESVAGVRPLSRGTVHVGDQLVTALRERERARLMAFVPQHPVVPSGMTVSDYVGLGRTAHQGLLVGLSAAGRALVAQLLGRLGLDVLATRDIATLSGGERQRAVIARALAQSCPVLILDEPTTGLDLRHQFETLELLRREVDESGLTILATLHDLTLAGQYADQLLLLDDGRLVAEGASRDVVRSPELARAYGIALRVVDVDGSDVVVPSRPPRVATEK